MEWPRPGDAIPERERGNAGTCKTELETEWQAGLARSTKKKCGLRLKTKLAAEPTGFVSDKSPAAWGRCKYAEVEQNRFNLQHP